MKHRHRKSRWNPAGGKIATAALAGYKPSALKQYAPVALGSFTAIYASQLLADRLPTGWQTGYKRIVVNLVSAGILGALTAMVAKKYAKAVFTGGMLYAIVAGLTPYVGPQVDKAVNLVAPLPVPVPVPVPAAAATVKGLAMDDYLDTGTRRLGELGCCGQGVPEMEAEALAV